MIILHLKMDPFKKIVSFTTGSCSTQPEVKEPLKRCSYHNPKTEPIVFLDVSDVFSVFVFEFQYLLNPGFISSTFTKYFLKTFQHWKSDVNLDSCRGVLLGRFHSGGVNKNGEANHRNFGPEVPKVKTAGCSLVRVIRLCIDEVDMIFSSPDLQKLEKKMTKISNLHMDWKKNLFEQMDHIAKFQLQRIGPWAVVFLGGGWGAENLQISGSEAQLRMRPGSRNSETPNPMSSGTEKPAIFSTQNAFRCFEGIHWRNGLSDRMAKA